ncbi:MAG: membrane-bound lytic murein transglycosylase MltF, partial [Gammaproteobacteria bacterium]
MVALTPKGHRIQMISGIVAALTIFLIIILIPSIHSDPLTTLDAIKKRGRLDVLTLNSATTYFQDIESENGFEYQLVKWFAES